jgi:TolA-binding protein
MRHRFLFILTFSAVAAHAQSRQELTDQITRLQTDLAETRRFAGSLTDRLAVLEAQHESLERWKREAESAMKQRNDLVQRLTELEKETAGLRQRQAELEQRQAQAATPALYNATPGVGAAARTTAAGDGAAVDDSMDYLTADSTTAKPAAKRPVAKAKPKASPRKKAAPKKRKRRRR